MNFLGLSLQGLGFLQHKIQQSRQHQEGQVSHLQSTRD